MYDVEFTEETKKHTKFIRVLRILMISTCTWPYRWTDNMILHKLQSIFRIVPIFAFYFFCTALPVGVVKNAIDQEQFDENTFMHSGIILDIMKIFTRSIIILKNKLFDFYKHIMLYEQNLLKSGESDVIECYMECARSLQIKLIILFLTTGECCFGYVTVEIVGNVNANRIHVANNESIEFPLLYPFYIPYYGYTEERIGIFYFINLIVVLFVVLGVQVTFGFTITSMTYASTRLRIFQIRLKNIKNIADTSYNGDVYLTLKIYIKEHQELISFIKNINEKIKTITLGEFLLSSMNCALAVVNTTRANGLTVDAVYSLGYTVLLIEQIFCYAAAANEIKLQSTAVIDACYACEWYTFDEKTKQLLLILMMRAYIPMEINIGPFSSMTNETALMMMKACYSYAAFIKDSME
ncbi:odorant receptor 10-like [Rhynchophorus ferrugineus]|uniref:Odorant receptor n=1 Tax=Rhynchophorus ferrugineus TaxID=354439 RepID=A0A834IRD6_RHYFE|nr:hypothetical protein GWI33_012309 [Rhynchophorus ferrugineus]